MIDAVNEEGTVGCGDARVAEAMLPTGNDLLSVPTLREWDAAIGQIGVLHMGMNGILTFCGGDDPLIAPRFGIDGESVAGDGRLSWVREEDWVPRFRFERDGVEFGGRILCPPGERGLVLALWAENRSPRVRAIDLGIDLRWGRMLHGVNTFKVVTGEKHLLASGWDDISAMEWRAPEPRLALALHCDDPGRERLFHLDDDAPSDDPGSVRAGARDRIGIRLTSRRAPGPGERATVNFFLGIGLDDIGALASAREMWREGADELCRRALAWLGARRRELPGAIDPDRSLARVMNENAFFNRFFATGRTVDTEEVVCVTSRSPRYYVSGAYWDRDALLWSFPSLLALDVGHAREVLLGVYARQRRNFGIHSRRINGAVLEPGFELDELCAPAIALGRFVEVSGDGAILDEPGVRDGLRIIAGRLRENRHPTIALYRTWLLPSDDPWPQRYVTYDNALVWRALIDLATLVERAGGGAGEGAAYRREAEAVRAAVFERCVVRGERGEMFAWSIDLEGGHILYDEPPGSLLLLPHYGFCSRADPVWARTRDWIHSPAYRHSFAGSPFEEVGCAHASHPWVLGAVNSLLAGEVARGVRFLSRARMDNGIACESVDEETGECATGAAFATCAGFVAYGLSRIPHGGA